MHGMCKSKLYNSWRKMKARCLDINDIEYHRYGAVGISVCQEWIKFVSFRDWAFANGYIDGLTIDRKDNNIGYNTDNCKWSTDIEQARNRSTCVYFEHNGEKHCLTEWCEILGVNVSTAFKRYYKGWSFEDIFSKPRNTNKQKINESEYCKIKELRKTSTLKVIADNYNVSEHTIRQILKKNMEVKDE